MGFTLDQNYSPTSLGLQDFVRLLVFKLGIKGLGINYLPNRRLFSALNPNIGLGSFALDAVQLPTSGSNVSVESRMSADPSDPPVTRNI